MKVCVLLTIPETSPAPLIEAEALSIESVSLPISNVPCVASGFELVNVNNPFTVRLLSEVTPAELLIVRLKKVEVPLMVCALEPLNETVPVLAVKVPLLTQLVFTSKVFVPERVRFAPLRIVRFAQVAEELIIG